MGFNYTNNNTSRGNYPNSGYSDYNRNDRFGGHDYTSRGGRGSDGGVLICPRCGSTNCETQMRYGQSRSLDFKTPKISFMGFSLSHIHTHKTSMVEYGHCNDCQKRWKIGKVREPSDKRDGIIKVCIAILLLSLVTSCVRGCVRRVIGGNNANQMVAAGARPQELIELMHQRIQNYDEEHAVDCILVDNDVLTAAAVSTGELSIDGDTYPCVALVIQAHEPRRLAYKLLSGQQGTSKRVVNDSYYDISPNGTMVAGEYRPLFWYDESHSLSTYTGATATLMIIDTDSEETLASVDFTM